MSNQHVAAVDLGSNSFHMIVAEVAQGRLKTIDRLREMVRLAAGLDSEDRITEKAMKRGIQCLQRFGQRLRAMPRDCVRVVGTNTLRKAHNREEFLQRARLALGHPIDIIAGIEEARLIYLGISHSLEDNNQQRLVMDIGGGSTEYILGQQFRPTNMESLHMGCVSVSQRFFRDGAITEKRMRKAEIAARLELEGIEALYKEIGWESVIGASGTILTVRDIVAANKWSEDGITADGMKKLRKALITAAHVDDLDLEGLQKERVPVFPGGFAILSATFESLGFDAMRVSSGALREGLLYDLVGRFSQKDVREGTIADLTGRYGVNLAHAQRVATTALDLYEKVADGWELRDAGYARVLRWAALLHSIGMAISHGQYHKHGAYLLENLDMPGFARGEQRVLAALVRGHRRKFPNTEFKALPKDSAGAARRLCVLLRLAALLHRSQSPQPLPSLRIKASSTKISLRFPDNWLTRRPLTEADLKREADYLRAAEIKLEFSTPSRNTS